MLRWRLTLGTVFVVALAGLCILDAQAMQPGVYLAPLAIAICAGASGEMLRIFRARGRSPSALACYAGPIVAVVLSCGPIVASPSLVNGAQDSVLVYLAGGLITSTLLICVVEMRRFSQPGDSALNIGLGCLSTLYVGGLLGMLVQLRMLSIDGAGPSFVPLGAMIALVKLSDTFQYFVGRAIGKHKLAPVLSPGKTWEGAVGGIAIAVVAGALLAPMVISSDAQSAAIVAVQGAAFALCVAVAGLTGDLAESLLKRDAGVKDSSAWMPGFGGILDMIDSLLFAAPAAFLFLVLVAD